MKFDTKEFELPETVYVRDIENRVFQGIIVQCLSSIDGISLTEGGFFDHILGREEGIAGIHAEQDAKQHSVSVKVEVNISYGVSIPEKAEEIQSKVVADLTRLTGLHVSQVHVIFKQLSISDSNKKNAANQTPVTKGIDARNTRHAEYTDIF